MALGYCYEQCLLNSHEPSFFFLPDIWKLSRCGFAIRSPVLCVRQDPTLPVFLDGLNFQVFEDVYFASRNQLQKNIDKETVILFLRAINLFVKMDVLWKREISWNML